MSERGDGVLGDLSVLIECHTVVCALPARTVTRLLLLDEATLRASDAPAAGGAVGILDVAGRAFAAWDLGSMLETPTDHRAWALLFVPHRTGAVPIALRTGTCIVVAHLHTTDAVPRGIFAKRSGAIPAAFAARALLGESSSALVGLCIDPNRLWSSRELEASQSMLSVGSTPELQ